MRGEPEPIAAAPSSPSNTTSLSSSTSSMAAIEPGVASVGAEEGLGEASENGLNGNAGKRPAWNKPSNGPGPEVGPVMGGAVSWPALSESTRASAKLPSESLKGSSDIGSPIAISQGTGAAPSSSQKQNSNNVNPNSTSSHNVPSRQRPIKRSSASTSSNGGLSHQQQAPAGLVIETAPNNPSPKDHMQRSGFGSQSHSGNDHPHHRSSFRSRNGGSHPRGDGSHNHGYGGRRDQDRGNQDWNAHRNFPGRDTHMQQQRVVPRFIRPPPPPPNSAPFIPPPQMRPFGTPIGFPELPPQVVYVATPPPDSIRGMPFVAPIPPHAVFLPAPDPQLHTKIVNQIDYYFSGENLIKDTYLRQNMDDQGWVPIKLIAGFNKVMHLTENIQHIVEALRASSFLEVQGDKVRRRHDWQRWIMPPAVQFPNTSGQQTYGKSSHDMLTAQVQNMALEKTADLSSARGQSDVRAEAFQSGLQSGDLSNQFQLSGGKRTDQVNSQAGSERN